ncbi:MAG: hypothetical protein K0S04_3664 [Herbinix sp.]|nr:hypothetical protein [Herbinix sp.]
MCIGIHLDLPFHPVLAKCRQSQDAGLRHLNTYTHIFLALVLGWLLIPLSKALG